MITHIKQRFTAKQVIKQLIPSVFVDKKLPPSEFISKYWKIYSRNIEGNNSLNGSIFEELIALTLIREKVFPFYHKARVAFIPNIIYDFIIYTENIGPISISAKTSLRERYKQADLEALALKHIHRESVTFLTSFDKVALDNLKKTPKSIMGIDEFILATGKEYDEMINSIKGNKISLAPSIEVVTSSLVITKQNYIKYY